MHVSKYLARNLVPGEEVYFLSGIHWASLISPFLTGVIAFAIYALILQVSELENGYWKLLFFAPALVPISALLRFLTTEIAVTNARVLYKTGLLNRDVEEIAVSKLESVNLHQGFIGRIFHYGRLHIRGTGGGQMDLRGMSMPMEMRSVINQIAIR